MGAGNSKKGKPKPRGRAGGTPASWKKGQSGNPKGRPRQGTSALEIARRIGDEKLKLGQGRGEVTMIDALIRKLYQLAIDRDDMAAARLVLSYRDGHPVTPISGVEDAPLRFVLEKIGDHGVAAADSGNGR